ncbi:hypothetical protein GUJ93_ZPchr0001g31836 [Zizania palustris]|uniref:Uncharacterized protein n=1 Tax=Zizania palustris TaxID=103762 RepID=A0A8J5VPT6_ZIZPA|nr:hypothetical protein GUJ93_ZPchr0001g31836 [Zizania palustris]
MWIHLSATKEGAPTPRRAGDVDSDNTIDDNLDGGDLDYDVSILGGGSPDRRSSCGLGQEGPDDGSGNLVSFHG